MVQQALLIWLLLYIVLFAIGGFAGVVLRGFLEREWSNRTVLRASSGLAFVGAFAIWVLIALVAG